MDVVLAVLIKMYVLEPHCPAQMLSNTDGIHMSSSVYRERCMSRSVCMCVEARAQLLLPFPDIPHLVF